MKYQEDERRCGFCPSESNSLGFQLLQDCSVVPNLEPQNRITSLSIFLLPTILACLPKPELTKHFTTGILFCPHPQQLTQFFLISEPWVSYGELLFFQLFQHQIGEDFLVPTSLRSALQHSNSGTRTIANL